MWHTVLITLHATAGVLALLFGWLAVRRARLFDVYLHSLAGMALFLAAAVAVEWQATENSARVLFTALTALAAFMVWRAVHARRSRPAAAARPSPGYVADVGFTLVALVDGFAVVTVLNLGAPVWLVVTTGVLIAVAGHFAITAGQRATAALGPPRPEGTAAPRS